MAGLMDERPDAHKVLITLSDDARPAIDSIASELRALGLDEVETFRLGGVIAGAASNANLAKMRRFPGVAHIESEPVLRSF